MGFFSDLGPWKIIIIVVVLLVLFGGATKLPMFAKGLGQSVRIFRKEMHDVKTDIQEERAAEAKPDPMPSYTAEPPAGTEPAKNAAGAPSTRPGSPDR